MAFLSPKLCVGRFWFNDATSLISSLCKREIADRLFVLIHNRHAGASIFEWDFPRHIFISQTHRYKQIIVNMSLKWGFKCIIMKKNPTCTLPILKQAISFFHKHMAQLFSLSIKFAKPAHFFNSRRGGKRRRLRMCVCLSPYREIRRTLKK